MSEEAEILKEIDAKLKGIIRLLAADKLEDYSSKEQIKRLHKMGLEPKEIAETLGKTPNNIRTQLSQLRQEDEIE